MNLRRENYDTVPNFASIDHGFLSTSGYRFDDIA